MARMTLKVVIEDREDGGVRIHAPGTGIVLSSANQAAAFADLGVAALETWRAVRRAAKNAEASGALRGKTTK